MTEYAKVIQFSGPNSVSILELSPTKKILVPCRKRQWGAMQDGDEYPLVRWVKILGSAVALYNPLSCTFIPTKDVSVIDRFFEYTVSWQSFHAVDKLCDKYTQFPMSKVERVRCWRGINRKMFRWVKDNPTWRDNLFWSWGTNTFRPGFSSYIEDMAALIRKGVMTYCENRSVR